LLPYGHLRKSLLHFAYNGIKSANFELLAEMLLQFGIYKKSGHTGIYPEKALKLYELCINTDKTYSGSRENGIGEIKKLL